MSDIDQVIKDLDAEIRFWRDGLLQYRQLIGVSAQYLTEQTIKHLETTKRIYIELKDLQITMQDLYNLALKSKTKGDKDNGDRTN